MDNITNPSPRPSAGQAAPLLSLTHCQLCRNPLVASEWEKGLMVCPNAPAHRAEFGISEDDWRRSWLKWVRDNPDKAVFPEESL